ncbi:hypothetical protein VKT23_012325 [Stygiomarasmius scandens]|uniref:Uncharacterized protein n=1 Tax=Marasmiellus scandens TaxID=2682957 RepID=A0ABR1J6K5_9AGAR
MFSPLPLGSSCKLSNSSSKKKASLTADPPKPSAHALSHQTTSQGNHPESIPLQTRSKPRTVSDNIPSSPSPSLPRHPVSNLRSTSTTMPSPLSSTQKINLSNPRAIQENITEASKGERSSAPDTSRPASTGEEEEEFFDTEGDDRVEEQEGTSKVAKGKARENPNVEEEAEEFPVFDEPLYISCSQINPFTAYGVMNNGNMPQHSAEASAELRDVIIRWEFVHKYHPFGNNHLLSIKDYAHYFPNIFYNVSSITPLPQQGRKPTLYTAGIVTLTAVGHVALGFKQILDTLHRFIDPLQRGNFIFDPNHQLVRMIEVHED